MKLYSLIKEVRALSKKSVYIPKIISLIPNLKKIEQISRVYSRVKEEEDKILGCLSESPRPSINLVCDLRCTPPTYGDFSAFLLTFKILNSKFRTNFFLVTDDFSSNWDVLDSDTAMRCLEDFKAMAAYVTDQPIKVIEEKNTFEQLSLDLHVGHTIFATFVNRRKKIYWDLKYLNVLLYKSLRCDGGVLFDRTNHFSITRKLPNLYVAWHIHYRQKLGESNSLSFEEGYYLLRSIVGLDLPIIIVSSSQKLLELMNIAIEKKLNVKSVREFSSSMLGDIDTVNGADLFFQVGGGGLAEFALYSEKPFCLVDYPDIRVRRWNSNYLGLKPFHRKFLPWQTHNQIFMRSKTGLKSKLFRKVREVEVSLGRVNKNLAKYEERT